MRYLFNCKKNCNSIEIIYFLSEIYQGNLSLLEHKFALEIKIVNIVLNGNIFVISAIE
jgi:hypothetical protein